MTKDHDIHLRVNKEDYAYLLEIREKVKKATGIELSMSELVRKLLFDASFLTKIGLLLGLKED